MSVNFGQNLKIIRKENNLTQKEFGEMFGISGVLIQKYEKCNVQPSFDFLQKVSQYFKVSIDDLINGDLKVTEKDIREHNYKVKNNNYVSKLQLFESENKLLREYLNQVKEMYNTLKISIEQIKNDKT